MLMTRPDLPTDAVSQVDMDQRSRTKHGALWTERMEPRHESQGYNDVTGGIDRAG
jgi:hypothetical protein